MGFRIEPRGRRRGSVLRRLGRGLRAGRLVGDGTFAIHRRGLAGLFRLDGDDCAASEAAQCALAMLTSVPGVVAVMTLIALTALFAK